MTDINRRIARNLRRIMAEEEVSVKMLAEWADAFHLMVYLNRLEERREKDEANNLRTYREARELSAWLAVYRFGNKERKKEAAKVIRAFVR